MILKSDAPTVLLIILEEWSKKSRQISKIVDFEDDANWPNVEFRLESCYYFINFHICLV